MYGALGSSNGAATERTLVSYFRSDEASKFVEMPGGCFQWVESTEFPGDSMAIVIVVGKVRDDRGETHPEAWKTESMTTGSKTGKRRS